MISGQFYALFNDPSANKQCVISTSDDRESIVITHDDLIADSMSLNSVLSSADDIVFGTCCGTQVEFKLNNTKLSSLNDRVISIDYYFDGIDDPFKIGLFKVINDSIESDRRSRKVTAVDSTELIKKADVAPWYNAIDFTSPITLRQLRTSLEAYMNLQYGIIFRWDTTEESPILCNDSLLVQKTISSEHVEFADVISSICELNGTFFIHDDEGKYYYKTLSRQSQATLNSTVIPPVTFANYVVPGINRVVIRENDDDDGVAYPDLEDIDDDVIVNNYILSGNFLTYGRTESTVEGSVRYAAQMLYNQIHDLSYTPVEADAVGNPCIEIGDCITIHAANGVDEDGYPVYEDIKTYIMERSLSGLKILKDKYTSSGSEVRETAIESSGSQIQQLKSVTSKLRYDQNGLVSQMQTMNDNMGTISTNVSTLTQTVSGFSTRIEQAEYNAFAASMAASGASSSVSELTQEVNQFNLRVSHIEDEYATQSDISQLDDEISAKVSVTAGNNTKAASWSITPENGMVITAHQANTDAFAVKVGNDKVVKVNSTGMELHGNLIIDKSNGIVNSVTDEGVTTNKKEEDNLGDYSERSEAVSELKEGLISTRKEVEQGFYEIDPQTMEETWVSMYETESGVDIGYDTDESNNIYPYIRASKGRYTSYVTETEIQPNLVQLNPGFIIPINIEAVQNAQLTGGPTLKLSGGFDKDMDVNLLVPGIISEGGVILANKYQAKALLDNLYSSRPSTADLTATGDGAIRQFKATSSMTTGKPAADGHILQFGWDNAGGYDSQLWIRDTASSHPGEPNIQVRGQLGGPSAWGKWVTVLDENNGCKQQSVTYRIINGGWHRLGLFGQDTTKAKSFLISITNSFSYHQSKSIVALFSIGYNTANITILSTNVVPGTQISKLGYSKLSNNQFYLDAYVTSTSSGSSPFTVAVIPLEKESTYTLVTNETMETLTVTESIHHDMTCGHATIGSNWSTGGTISFGKTFASAPKVVATYSQASWVSGQIGAIKVRNVTTTGFEASISGTWDGSVGIDWIAMT